MAEVGGMSQSEMEGRELDKRLGVYKKEATIVVVGRPGAGKSSLLNKVLGLEIEVKSLSGSGTTELDKTVVEKNGVTLTVVDTIGLAEHQRKQRKQLKDLTHFTNNKADLLIFCIPVGPGSRFENNNPKIMRALQKCYGQNIWRNCLVVFTFSNQAWDSVKKEEAATTTYIEYLNSYTNNFKKELESMEVTKEIRDNVKSIFEVKEAQTRPTIVTIPAGYDMEDPILPGIELDEKEKWVGNLFVEIIQTASKESRRALLEFRYTREVIIQALQYASKKVTKTLVQAIEKIRGQWSTSAAQTESSHDTLTLPLLATTTAEAPTTSYYTLAKPPSSQPPTATTTTSVVPTHPAVRKFLKPLFNTQLRQVGLELGLRWPHLKKMMEDCVLDDMLDSWLREDDDVTETSGSPSWQSLVKALEEAGCTGVAAKIKQEKLL